MSQGSEKLLTIVKEVFPNQIIVLEHNIGEHNALFLDIYLPQLLVAFEFDGQQHYTYNRFFHKNPERFLASKKRDKLKSTKCHELGIKLIRIKFDEEITRDLVLTRLKEALNHQED
jgi:hypothetical protein